MSRYGRGDLDDMACELDEFLEVHTAAELLRLVTDAIDWYEEKKIDENHVEHGQWVHCAHREPQYDISGVKTWGEEYQCSNCGFVHSVIEDFGHYAYCPNCGAKMDEAINEQE